MRGWSLAIALSLTASGLIGGLLRSRDGALAQSSADITLSDTEFPAANWTVHVASSGGASQTAQQNASGGNPGSWRLMTHTIFPNSWVYVWHLYAGTGSTYIPSQQGAIDTLDFSLDQIANSGNGVGGAFAVSQNGRYYTARYATFNNTSWQRVQAACLTAANFVASDGGPDGSPDFSAAGGPIQFGFARANPVPTVVGGIFDHGIDNWSVRIHRPGSTCGNCPSITVDPAPLPQAYVGLSYSASLAVVGGTAPYTFAFSSPPPPGLSISSGGLISGTPTAVGVFSLIVTPTDAAGCLGLPQTVDISVNACPPLTFSPAILPYAVVGTPYRHVISISSSDYLLAGVGDIPPGLTLSGDGVLSGIPTLEGNFSPVVRASGGPNCELDHTYHMVVGPCLIPPPPTGLQVDRATASSGEPYNLTWDLPPTFGGHWDVLASVDGGAFLPIGITGIPAFTEFVPVGATSTMRFQVEADWLCGPARVSAPSPRVALQIVPGPSAGALLPLRSLEGLQGIDVDLFGRHYSFQADSPLLTERLVDPLSFPTPDFIGSDTSEHGDIFYSNADGTPNPDGSFVTLESVYTKTAPALGGLNVSNVALRFATRTESANAVTSFVAMGDSAESSTVTNAADGSVSTYAILGNTNGGGAFARLRITLGFASTAPRPDLQVSITGGPTTNGYARNVVVRNGGPADATGVSLDLGHGSMSNVSGGTLVCTPSPPFADLCHIDIGLVAGGATASVGFEVADTIYGRYVTATDDGTHGPDANPADNSAALADVVLCRDECDSPLPCDVCRQVCNQLPNSIVGSLKEAASRLVRRARVALDSGTRLILYYNFRDRILAGTPVGRRYIQLYEAHRAEVVQLSIGDSSLNDLELSAMAAWEPALRVLLDGPGTNATFTQRMADTMTALLERMKQIGSAGLRADVAREQSLLDLNALVGKTLDESHRAIDAQPCAASDAALCLQGGRFRVETAWKKPDGTSGTGHASALTADSGTFWFFDPANVEMVVKALNGCGVDQHYWVFAGGLTNVEVTMTVTDTQTGDVKTYLNPQGTAFAPILDTQAFATCSAAALLAPDPEAPSAKTPRGSRERKLMPGVACTPGSTSLCLDGSRFRVEAAWTTADGQTGAAQAVSLSPDSGYFWFFDPGNVEMLVKVLNGCGIDASHWVFAGGLTNVRVVLTVTDTQTGAVRTYTNPQGASFQPIQDTSAFQACP